MGQQSERGLMPTKMSHAEALAIITALPLQRADEYSTESYETVWIAYCNCRPRSRLARAVEVLGGVSGAAEALAGHTPYWDALYGKKVG